MMKREWVEEIQPIVEVNESEKIVDDQNRFYNDIDFISPNPDEMVMLATVNWM